jgi:N-acetylneuraminic acid mutarotase
MRERLSKSLTGLGLSLALIGCSDSVNSAESTRQDWSTRAPLLEANSEMAVVESNGKIYVIGGYPSTRVTVAAVQVYDTKTDRWEITTPLPLAVNHTVAAAANGKLYVIGGQTSAESAPERAGFVDTVFVYDPAKATWTRRASMPTARGGGAAVVVDGEIYVAGGRPPRGADFAVYDPSADMWTTLPNLPTQRNHIAAAAIDGKIFVAGGRFEGGFRSQMTNVLEVFDPKTGAWASRKPMPTVRGGVNGIAANGCLHVFGGEGNAADPKGLFHQHEVYNPVTDSWTSLEPMPVPVHGVTGAVFIDGWIHLPGGGTEQGGSSGSTIHQVYRPTMQCRP